MTVGDEHPRENEHALWRGVKRVFVSFVVLAPLAPGVLAVLTAALYVSRDSWREAASWSPPELVLIALVVGLILLFLLAAVSSPSIHPWNANPSVYQALRAELAELRNKARGCPANAIVVEELDDVLGELTTRSGSVRWSFGSGYVAMWRRLHRADEAILDLSAPPVAASEAIYDLLRVTGSAIPNRAELARQLIRGAPELCEAARPYLNVEPLMATSQRPLGDGQPVVAAAPLEVVLAAAGAEAVTETAPPNGGATATTVAPDVGRVPDDDVNRELARAVVHKVRKAVNDFRDDRREELTRLRTLLAGHVLATSLIAYLTLVLALLQGPPTSAVVAASAFVLVGALVGLFRQLDVATRQATVPEEDYGLGYARLLATPLFSGLAGVAGVYLTAAFSEIGPALAGTATTVDVPTLADVYDLRSNGAGLLVAAVFGLTPNLLINRLQAQADASRSDLKSSQIGEQKHATT